jgi:hypothetical protein
VNGVRRFWVPCYRVSLPLAHETRSYVELGAGLSVLAHPLIDNGTNWNFFLLAGLGVEKQIGSVSMHVGVEALVFNVGSRW